MWTFEKINFGIISKISNIYSQNNIFEEKCVFLLTKHEI